MSHPILLARRSFLTGITLVGLTTASRSGEASVRELAMIVNKSCPLSELDAQGVRLHFLRQIKEWSDGGRVRPVQQEGDVRAVFLSRVLNMSSVDYERYWLQQKYAAAESPPKIVEGNAAVVKFVGLIKGAIGFVNAAAIDDEAKSRVKAVLRVSY